MSCYRAIYLFTIITAFLLGDVFADAPEKKPPRKRPDNRIGNLLDDLEDQNQSRATRFKDTWLESLKDITELGDEAIPELIEELDYTDDDMTIRCMGFTLRAIDDKRAVPALIRAIPKTLVPPGSDMGLRVQDEDLEPFAHKHEIGDQHEPGLYSFGRPVREVFGALHRLTGEDFGDQEIFSIFLDGNEHQINMKRDLFHRQAEKWATWWEANAEKLDVEERYRVVNLPKREPTNAPELLFDIPYKSDSGNSNYMLEPAQFAEAGLVFFDFDTARAGKLPKKWRPKEDLKPGDNPKLPMKEILAWAEEEGYDMMGQELVTPEQEPVFAIRLIGIKAVQLPMKYWQRDYKKILLEVLINDGTPHEGEYLFKRADGEIEHFKHAPFVIVTREGSPGILSLGIEVRDDSLKPGGIGPKDDELNPIAFRKGRRFAFKYLVPAEEEE